MHKNPGVMVTITASADLAKNLFVGFDGNPCAANAKALGVVDVATGACDPAPVMTSGIALVRLGGTVSKGAPLASDAAGKAVAASAAAATVPSGSTAVLSSAVQPEMAMAGGYLPQAINGYALEDGASDDIIRVLLS